MFKVPEKFRVTKGLPPKMKTLAGNNGVFIIDIDDGWLQCIATDGSGWEHVSIVLKLKGDDCNYTPEWDEMCEIKNLFWGKEDNSYAVAYHNLRNIKKQFPERNFINSKVLELNKYQ